VRRAVWLLPLLLNAAGAPKPKPLTAEQRAEALAAAVETQQAEIAVHRLEAQYRAMREKLIAAHEEAARKEDEIAKRLRVAAGAEGCALSSTAEWKCK
jgi:outer membrane murein-binding lipoprotein Lpp